MGAITKVSWYRQSKPSLPHFQSLPFHRQRSLFLAVFCLFSVIGFFVDLMQLGHLPYVLAIAISIMSGIIAIIYVILGTRFPNYYTAIFSVLQVGFWIGFGSTAPSLIHYLHLQSVSTERGVPFAAVLILAATMLSYVFFLKFIRTEGQEAVRIKNELELAHGIQKTLVPPIHLRTPLFEIYGRSDPSDKVGGDLVDAVLLEDGSAVAYVADIAGHGLQAGILMGMVKTAARTALLDADHTEPHVVLPSLMECLNRVLPCVKEPQMYATFAGFRLHSDGSVFYALAAHPPILHYRVQAGARHVDHLSQEQLPLGLLPADNFASDITMTEQGDILVIVTDGILEACNQADEEFGLDRLQNLIANHAGQGLPAMAEAILNAARAFGKQIDDQTLLLIRRL